MEEAQHLLHAAAFYEMPGLLELCLSALERRLAVDNVVETLIAADKVGARAAGLKLAALRFVNNNTRAVVRLPGWWGRVSQRLASEALHLAATGEVLPAATVLQQQLAVEIGVFAGGTERAAAVAGAAAAGEAGRNVRRRTE